MKSVKKVAKKILESGDIQSLFDDVSIHMVDGERVRLRNIKFTMGGHHYVYKHIPEDEIWIESGMNKVDVVCTTLHEFIERLLMKKFHYAYDPAHDIANIMEIILRKKLSSKISDKEYYTPTKFNKKIT